ncbi:Fc.00g066890.m01.CDS01 [Cosmosporella sp. VM-42]
MSYPTLLPTHRSREVYTVYMSDMTGDEKKTEDICLGIGLAILGLLVVGGLGTFVGILFSIPFSGGICYECALVAPVAGNRWTRTWNYTLSKTSHLVKELHQQVLDFKSLLQLKENVQSRGSRQNLQAQWQHQARERQQPKRNHQAKENHQVIQNDQLNQSHQVKEIHKIKGRLLI